MVDSWRGEMMMTMMTIVVGCVRVSGVRCWGRKKLVSLVFENELWQEMTLFVQMAMLFVFVFVVICCCLCLLLFVVVCVCVCCVCCCLCAKWREIVLVDSVVTHVTLEKRWYKTYLK